MVYKNDRLVLRIQVTKLNQQKQDIFTLLGRELRLRLRLSRRQLRSSHYKRSKLREVEPINMLVQIENIETKMLVDSGSVCEIIPESLANGVVLSNKYSYWTNM